MWYMYAIWENVLHTSRFFRSALILTTPSVHRFSSVIGIFSCTEIVAITSEGECLCCICPLLRTLPGRWHLWQVGCVMLARNEGARAAWEGHRTRPPRPPIESLASVPPQPWHSGTSSEVGITREGSVAASEVAGTQGRSEAGGHPAYGGGGGQCSSSAASWEPGIRQDPGIFFFYSPKIPHPPRAGGGVCGASQQKGSGCQPWLVHSAALWGGEWLPPWLVQSAALAGPVSTPSRRWRLEPRVRKVRNKGKKGKEDPAGDTESVDLAALDPPGRLCTLLFSFIFSFMYLVILLLCFPLFIVCFFNFFSGRSFFQFSLFFYFQFFMIYIPTYCLSNLLKFTCSWIQ